MKTIEYRTMQKEKWGDGPWLTEPDKKQWLDDVTGYPCLIVRNPLGALCGYVGVNAKHPCYDQDYDNVDVDVHGGLTFSNPCQKYTAENMHLGPIEQMQAEAICHLVENDEDDNIWWLGFDCAHLHDLVPDMARHNRSPQMAAIYAQFNIPTTSSIHADETYRDINYVTNEVLSLALQLKSIEIKGVVNAS